MSKLHLDYSEYKTLIGDYGVTPWTKYNWLSGPESPFFGGFKKVDLSTFNWSYTINEDRHFFAIPISSFVGLKLPDVSQYGNMYIAGYMQITRGARIVSGQYQINTVGDTFLICDNNYSSVADFKAAMKGKFLIYEKQSTYKHLSYIQATGTQYIDTGIKSNSLIDLRLRAKLITDPIAGTGSLLAGAYEDTQSKCLTIGGRVTGTIVNVRFGSLAANLSQFSELSRTTIYDFETNKESFTIRNVETSESVINFNWESLQTFEEGPNIWIGKTQAVSTVARGTNIYSCKIYDNGVLVRDFIPARRNSDNAVGMYDTVTGQFYGNSGTGSFIAGEIQ